MSKIQCILLFLVKIILNLVKMVLNLGRKAFSLIQIYIFLVWKAFIIISHSAMPQGSCDNKFSAFWRQFHNRKGKLGAARSYIIYSFQTLAASSLNWSRHSHIYSKMVIIFKDGHIYLTVIYTTLMIWRLRPLPYFISPLLHIC